MCHSFGILQAPRKTLQETINGDNKYCRSEHTNEAPREPLALRALQHKLCIISWLLSSSSHRSVHIKHFTKENEVWFVSGFVLAQDISLSLTKFWKIWSKARMLQDPLPRSFWSLRPFRNWFHKVKMQNYQEQQCFTGGKAGMLHALIWSVQTGQTPCLTS